MAGDDALERRPGNNTPQVLVVMQAGGGQDSQKENPGGETAAEPVGARHAVSSLGQTPSAVNGSATPPERSGAAGCW